MSPVEQTVANGVPVSDSKILKIQVAPAIANEVEDPEAPAIEVAEGRPAEQKVAQKPGLCASTCTFLISVPSLVGT